MFCPVDGIGRRPAAGRRRSLPGRASEPARAKEPIIHFLYNCVLSRNIIPAVTFPWPFALHLRSCARPPLA